MSASHLTRGFLLCFTALVLGACSSTPQPLPVEQTLSAQYTQAEKEHALDVLYALSDAESDVVAQEIDAWNAANPGATLEQQGDASTTIILNHEPSLSGQGIRPQNTTDRLGIGPNQKAICFRAPGNFISCVRTRRQSTFAGQRAQVWYGNGMYGGKIDAFRHSYWNALMVRENGETFAVDFAEAHELDNPTEPALSQQMDRFNNTVGQNVGGAYTVEDFTNDDVEGYLKYLMSVGG